MGSDKPKEHLAGLAINIPTTMIEDTIRAHMIQAMPNPEIWVSEIIKLALEEPTNNSYGRNKETKFNAAISKMVRSEAETIFKEWIEEHRAMIRKAIVTEMEKSKGRRIKQIAEKMADGLTKVYVGSINLSLSDDE